MFQRIMIGALVLTASTFAAESPKKSKAVAAKTASKPAPSKPAPALTIPADAERVGEHEFRKREADGKVYIYRRTPFGVARMEETAVQQSSPSTSVAEEPVQVVEEGDTVRFERKGPFGKNVWTRKKSELNAEERSLLEKRK